MNIKKYNILSVLFLSVVAALAVSFIASCGKSDSVLPAGSNIQFQVVNLSTDLQPIDLYINTTKRNPTPYRYPNPSGYFTLATIDTPFRIRSAATSLSSVNILTIDSVLKNNMKYTLFITGFKSKNTISYIFTKDTASITTGGRGKVRFVHATAGTDVFNITANGTTIFTNQAYKNVSKFIEMPAGNYDFKIYSTNSSTTVLYDLPNVNIQDSKLYTLYCRGIVGRTDTAAFGLGVLNNK